MAEDPNYQPGTQGALLGYFAALAFAALLGMALLFVLAWGGAHCEPVPQCQRGSEAIAAVELAIVAALAVSLGLAVRSLFNWSQMRRFDRERAGRPPIWAMVVVSVLGLLALTVLSAIAG